jgi:hypothetical protein
VAPAGLGVLPLATRCNTIMTRARRRRKVRLPEQVDPQLAGVFAKLSGPAREDVLAFAEALAAGDKRPGELKAEFRVGTVDELSKFVAGRARGDAKEQSAVEEETAWGVEAAERLDAERLKRLRALEGKVLDWLAESPEHRVRFTADPIGALADAQLVEPDLLADLKRIRDALSLLAPGAQPLQLSELRMRLASEG